MNKPSCYLKTLSTVLLALGCGILPGCSFPDLKPGESVYHAGKLSALEETTMDRAWFATRDALKALRLNPRDWERDEFSAVIEGETSGRRGIRVTLQRKSETTTEIGIRILFSRDREMAEQILKEIQKRLS